MKCFRPLVQVSPVRHARETGSNFRGGQQKAQSGFSTIETLIVLLLLSIVLSLAIPSVSTISQNLRMSGDARSIAQLVDRARMSAAADFTHSRVYLDLKNNTFHLEIWDKTAGCWKTDGNSHPCTQATSPVTPLSQGDTFGFGSIAVGPTTATGIPVEPPNCTTGAAGASAGSSIPLTACVEINSRGYPVDSTNTIAAGDAIYLTNNQSQYTAVAVSITGQPSAYIFSGANWAAF
jgi:type II secretory pathway pseudopilin PulG